MDTTYFLFSSSNPLVSHCFVFIAALLVGCNGPAGTPNVVSSAGLVNKSWNMTHFKVKDDVGMLYQNKKQVVKDAAAYEKAGANWHFFEDGRFTITEGGAVYYGQWRINQKRQWLDCVYSKNQEDISLSFANVFLDEKTLTAELHYRNISYTITAVAGEKVFTDYKNDPFYPK